MEKLTRLTIFGVLFFLGFQLNAQVNLPYYSGFDNTTEQDGWAEYKTAATEFSHWDYNSFSAYSEPNCIGHDYSPSSGITLTDNWFVSPGFSITSGGYLDSIRYKFSGFSVPETGDTIAIYLLTGSQNPSAASSKILLFDFRGSEYIADNTYKLKTDIPLPASTEMCYLAIRYRNTDCSSKWLTVLFDNIAISANPTGLNDPEQKENEISVHPNPSSGNFSINHSGDLQSLTVYNAIGKTIYQDTEPENTGIINIDLSNQPKGIYILRTEQDGSTLTRKLIVQ